MLNLAGFSAFLGVIILRPAWKSFCGAGSYVTKALERCSRREYSTPSSCGMGWRRRRYRPCFRYVSSSVATFSAGPTANPSVRNRKRRRKAPTWVNPRRCSCWRIHRGIAAWFSRVGTKEGDSHCLVVTAWSCLGWSSDSPVEAVGDPMVSGQASPSPGICAAEEMAEKIGLSEAKILHI